MKSYAQASQDLFADIVLGGVRGGSFVDVGANNPISINNTYALETERGYRGLLVDNSGESMEACERERSSHFYLTDAAQPQNWLAAFAQAELPLFTISYLSLDIDAATLDCLRNLPLDKVRFRVATIEHDAYRNPPEHRQAILDIMRDHGYECLCADVTDKGLPFEAWFIDPDLVDTALAARFRRPQPTEWKEFFV